MSYAINTLVGEAYKWWKREEANRIYHNEPVYSWYEMAWLMNNEFVKNAKDHISHHTGRVSQKNQKEATSRRSMKPQKQPYTTRTEKAPQSSKSSSSREPKSTHMQGNSNVLKESIGITCYRCKNNGHIAKDCPSKKETIETSLGEVSSRNLTTQETKGYLNQASANETTKEAKNTLIDPGDKFLKPEKQNQEPRPQNMLEPQAHLKVEEDQVLASNKVISELIVNKITCPTNVMIHLYLDQNSEKGLGTMEKQHEIQSQVYSLGEVNGEPKGDIRDFTKEATLLPNKVSKKPWKGVIASFLIKEEPPDATIRLKPSLNTHDNRGKVLNPKPIQKSNLTSLCADPTILRTKFSQGGGYDEVIRSVVEPELHPTCHTSQKSFNNLPEKGDMATKALKSLQDHTKSSCHPLALIEDSLRHFIPEVEDPGRPVEEEDLSSHLKTIEEHSATIFNKLSTNEGQAYYDPPVDLFRTKEAYSKEENSHDTIFWVISHLGQFKSKSSPLRKVWLQLVSFFFCGMRTTFEDSKGTRDYHLISWLYWIARRIKD